jgi:hypothetical protein
VSEIKGKPQWSEVDRSARPIKVKLAYLKLRFLKEK